MIVSATAENASQMMTMTLKFWKWTNSGMLSDGTTVNIFIILHKDCGDTHIPQAIEVPMPPPLVVLTTVRPGNDT